MIEIRDGFLVTDEPEIYDGVFRTQQRKTWFDNVGFGFKPSQVREAIKAVEGQAWFGVADHEPDYEDPTYGTDYADEAENKIGWTYLADNALTSNRTCGWLRKLWEFAQEADDDV